MLLSSYDQLVKLRDKCFFINWSASSQAICGKLLNFKITDYRQQTFNKNIHSYSPKLTADLSYVMM